MVVNVAYHSRKSTSQDASPRVVAETKDHTSSHDREDGSTQDAGQVVYTTLCCGIAFDGLEPNRQEVTQREKRAKEEEGEDGACPDRAPLDHTRGDNSTVSLPVLNHDKDGEK